MSRLMRWVVVLAASAAAFLVCVWLFQFATFSWLPHAAADRWVLAAAFAGAIAGVVGMAVGWWAGRDRPDAAPGTKSGWSVQQKARASGRSRITQVGRDQNDARK